MAVNMAVSRIKREFKEVMRSEEVIWYLHRFLSHACQNVPQVVAT